MPDVRTSEQVTADFRRVDPRFEQVTGLDYLSGILTDDRLGEAALYASGAGPVFFDLGVLRGPEWEGVQRFLNSRLVAANARAELNRLREDLTSADRDRNGVLDNREIVRFARTHSDRWPTVAQFRNAAEILLNRLPSYLAQRDLNRDDIAHLWGVMNHFGREMDRLRTPVDRRGTVYGLSLQGFPSEDRNNPPALIRRAMNGELTPQELASVRHVLQARLNADRQYDFAGSAPLTPLEIGVLGTILDSAARRGRPLNALTLVGRDREAAVFAGQNQAAERCLQGIRAAARVNEGSGLPQAFERCSADLARIEGDHPERLSTTTLLLRAYAGQLSPSETALLRTWMQSEGRAMGLVCDGTWDCLATGARRLFQSIAENPGHFIARNAAFLGGSYLYSRLILRNAFERRLTEACGGTVANPRQAYAAYERHLADQMRNSPLWRRALNQLARNPRRDGLFGRLGVNFPVIFMHLAAFNAIASLKDTGRDWIDIPTDLPLIPLFHAYQTYDAFRNASIQSFAQANPGLCQQQGQGAEAPAPEAVAEAAPAPNESQSQRVGDEAFMSVLPDYSQMICRGNETHVPVLDPELDAVSRSLDESRTAVGDRRAVARPSYVTLDQIRVETPGSVNAATPGERPGIPMSPIVIPNLQPAFTPRYAPAFRPR